MERYVLLDINRNMYWKYNNYGYTKILKEARIFTLEEANKKANDYNVNDLKVIEYDKAKEVIDENLNSHEDLKAYIKFLFEIDI